MKPTQSFHRVARLDLTAISEFIVDGRHVFTRDLVLHDAAGDTFRQGIYAYSESALMTDDEKREAALRDAEAQDHLADEEARVLGFGAGYVPTPDDGPEWGAYQRWLGRGGRVELPPSVAVVF